MCQDYSRQFRKALGGITYNGGTLACTDSCEFDTSACTSPVCGDNKRESSEKCDGTDIDSDCKFLGFDYGDLGCKDDCLEYDNSSCSFFDCGNGIIDGIENCDTANLNAKTCVDLDYTSGSLRCGANCQFDTSQCISVCGNNIQEVGELCDGSDLAGTVCSHANYGSGDLNCASDCKSFDFSDCNKIICGDGICSHGEDGKCDTDCLQQEKEVIRVSINVCGDKQLGLSEQCDGQLLAGYTCTDLGFTGGTISCTDECRLNITSCNYLASSELTAKALAKQTLSTAIKTANLLIMQAKTEDKETAPAETLLLDVIKDYAGGSTDYEIMTEKLQDIPILLEGGSIEEKQDLPMNYIIGIIVLALLLMLAFMFRGLGKSK